MFEGKSLYQTVKGVVDPLLAVVLFVLTLPFAFMIALAILIDSPGPVIFSQIRVGKNCKRFRFYKFRTMWHDARKRYPELYRYKFPKDKVGSFRIKLANDPRVTFFGRYLRKTSLDELPNFINVIRGEMALVGPRPEIPEMLQYYSKSQMAKFTVKPGITGYAQVSGRGLLTFRQTIDYDLRYIKEKSLFADLKILVKTVSIVIKGIGAF